MKQFAIAAICWLVAFAALAGGHNDNPPMRQAQNTIAVISDPHLLAPELHNSGRAARQLAAGDMKMALRSDSIMEALVDKLLQSRPSLLLVTGDLTHNGARASHDRLARHLARLERGGVRTLVIPGNHDINNPFARSYRGDAAQPVATVTRQEFAQIYANHGYGMDSERDPASLSYACEPIDGVVVLAIDTNRDEENRRKAAGDSEDTYLNGGRIKPETLQWACERARQARAQDKQIVAMMHHHLLEHVDGEAHYLPSYIVEDHLNAARTLAQAGVRLMLTGHLHITDAVADGSITEVATGSATTYPFPLRELILPAIGDTASVVTRFGDQWLDRPLVEAARGQVEQSAHMLAGLIAGRLWPKLQSQLQQLSPMLVDRGIDPERLPQNARQAAELMMRHLREPLTASLLSVVRGGEDPRQAGVVIQAIRQGTISLVGEIMPGQAKHMGPFLVENLLPRLEPTLRSALEDRNRVGTPQEASTPDHRLNVAL